VKINDVIFTKGMGSFFFDDQAAIKGSLTHDGFLYKGNPQTTAFGRVRTPSEAVLVALILEDGQIALGDCCSVQYPGAGGRDPLFLADSYIAWMENNIKPQLISLETSSFRKNAKYLSGFKTQEGTPIHTAIRYGVTQALLDATGKSHHCTITEVVAREYGLPLDIKPLKIFTQSGDDVRTNADKMILKSVDVLPHGLINDPKEKVGVRGEKLKELVRWLKNRILEHRLDESYFPEMHFDVYGTLGIVFEDNLERIVDYLSELDKAAAPFSIRIEGPIDAGSRDGQIEAMKKMTELIEKKGLSVEIVADEWCNTLEDIQFFASERAGHMLQIKTPDLGGIDSTIEATILCKEKGVKAYQGGSCAETDISSRICTQVALATQPYQILAKPGMGVDEGFAIVKNEMARSIAILHAR